MANSLKEAYYQELIGDIAKLHDEIKGLPLAMKESFDPTVNAMKEMVISLDAAKKSYTEMVSEPVKTNQSTIDEANKPFYAIAEIFGKLHDKVNILIPLNIINFVLLIYLISR